ncbi:MAG TPA: hypothetical protein VF742_02695, partial [Terracidiphilus sp.]
RIRGIGVDQGAALLLEPDGNATVVGHGNAYFIDPHRGYGELELHSPLTFGPYKVQKVTPGHAFNLKTWTGDTTNYFFSVKDGVIHSTQAGGAIY